MKCDKCGSEKIVHVNGKCGDSVYILYKENEKSGEVPRNIGIGEGDYIKMDYCLDCGKIQGKFPVDDRVIKNLES